MASHGSDADWQLYCSHAFCCLEMVWLFSYPHYLEWNNHDCNTTTTYYTGVMAFHSTMVEKKEYIDHNIYKVRSCGI